jgi:hypothetical protein
LVSLEQCANLLADAANGLAFLSAWQRWRGADLVPTARQVKPEELGRALSSLSIFNVYSRERSAYHLVGAVHENLMGENPTGDDISTKTAKIDLDRRLERLWYAASAPCGIVADVVYVRRSGYKGVARRLFLPVMPSSIDGPMTLYTSVDSHGEEPAYDEPAVFAKPVQEFTYVDIGGGAPKDRSFQPVGDRLGEVQPLV